jgi:hypothetical protein
METMTLEAAILEEAVCSSKEKQLRLHCHAKSGIGWVEIAGRRFVGKRYVAAARHLHKTEKLEITHADDQKTVFNLGHHVCSKKPR